MRHHFFGGSIPVPDIVANGHGAPTRGVLRTPVAYTPVMSAMDPEGRVEPLSASAIQREMRDRETMLWSDVGLKLAGGLPLSLALPLALAIIFTLLGWANDWPFSFFWLWLLFFAALYALFAWRLLPRQPSEGPFIATMLKFVSLQPENDAAQLSLEDLPGQEPAQAARILFAPLLKGPSLLLDAWELVQARRKLTPVQHERAVELLRDLSSYATGIPWLRLRRDGESVNDVLLLLGFLKLTDWIGVGKERKVWMLSDARKAASH